MKVSMDTQVSGILNPVLFTPSPHLGDSVNSNIIRSEIEGGVYLKDLAPGSALAFETKNRVYKMVVLGDGAAMISGHPEFCPEPTEVQIHGSTWGGPMIRARYLGRGMHLEFEHPLHQVVVTSRILDIRAAA
jgi:hypothetical protein